MKLPPRWKIQRELVRAARKALKLPPELLRRVYFRRYYDWILSHQIKRSSGTLTLGSEIAIYLIFPKSGILPSHISALKQMVAAKISPIVVSNQPLGTDDKTAISPYCALIIERPNFGYDFGGYRDGVLEVANRFETLDRLWLLNDSVWMFPRQSTWFDDARELNVDFAAATSNFAMARVDAADFRDITWKFQVTHRNFHYASYALGVGSAILKDPNFLKYWRKLEIRNDKTRTVRRGEIGLSKWVLKHGYSHRATCEVDTLDKELMDLTDTELDSVVRDLVIPGVIPGDIAMDDVKTDVLRLNVSSCNGRSDRVALILTAVSRYACVYSLPAYIMRYRGFQFLKKSPLWLSPISAGLMLKIISRIPGDVGDEILQEATHLVCQDAEPCYRSAETTSDRT